jgi:mRNA interferase MazF
MLFMTSYDFGDAVLVPFPFTDQTSIKKRPAVVVSSIAYNIARFDVILMAITSQRKTPLLFGEVEVVEWSKAGLLKPSVIKPVVTTVEKNLLLRQLGKLEPTDLTALRTTLPKIFG